MERGIFLFTVLVLLALSFASAGTYTLEFSQTGKGLVVNESINNTPSTTSLDMDALNFAGSEIYFLKKVVFPEDFKEVNITLNLERGIVVKNNEIFPAGYAIGSNGENISISWNLTEVKKGDSLAMFVNLQNVSNPLMSPWLIVLFLFALFGAFWFVIYLRRDDIFKRKPARTKKPNGRINKTNEKSEDVRYDHLLDTEKKVIEELKKADRNELWQKQIQTSTGFSKAKVSRLIRNLESRGLVRKIPFGNTNKVRLK